MASANHSVTGAETELIAGSFRFISIQAPDEAKNQTKRRLARSHAVKQALEKKRKLEQQSTDNFRVTTSEDEPGRSVRRKRIVTASLCSLSAGALDPFQTLAVDCTRLQSLLADYKARQAPEPVFTIAEELSFQDFRSVFRTGLVDPALLNASMLSFAFAAAGGSVDRECLGYQGQAIRYIRERMGSLHEAASESTIGAILLLAGVEARLGMKSQVQLHMSAVQRLLEICRTESVHLTDGIKRAIFWQDLNSSVLSGSDRIVDHTTFAELQWKRDPFSPNFFCLPPGFQKRSDLFTNEFTQVLEDLHALQCIRNIPRFAKGDLMLMVHVNNHTASIQSRLAAMPTLSPILKCCRLVAYVCSVMLCCKVWCASVIPPSISLQLLRELQQADDSIWNEHPDLLLWILHMGGAFASIGTVRSGYLSMVRLNKAARFGDRYKSWPELLTILRQFIWSDDAFITQVKGFWEEILAQDRKDSRNGAS